MLLAVFAIPAVADDVGKWIKDLNDSNPSVREVASKALMETYDARALEPLIQALNDEDNQVRAYAVIALGNLNDSRAVDPLTQALKDKENFVRANAAEALGNLNDPRAIEPLKSALNNENESDVRRIDEEAFRKQGWQAPKTALSG